VRRPHGVSGEVAVEPVTDFPERFVEGLRLVWTGGGNERPLTVASVRPHGERLLIRFAEVAEDAARSLSGGELFVDERDAVAPPEDYYYGWRVEGWRCEDTQGRPLGVVARLETTGGGPMLEVETGGGGEPVAVPFTRPLVVAVDEARRTIVLDPPEGLMELE
jgi:16S rRNA processing protein RimM